MKLEDWRALGFETALDQDQRKRMAGQSANHFDVEGDRQYHPCPEAHPTDGAPAGSLHRIRDWSDCKAWPLTRRHLGIYTPPGFDPGGPPPALAVFNDGDGYLSRKGPVRATLVFDSLINSGELPPTVAVFVMPGQSDTNPDQRSLEYDTLNTDFLNFLKSEILPLVVHHIGCDLDTNPARRLICGMSSGGICAFNAAWHDPDCFGLVLSHCGSFTNIRGGHNIAPLVRRSDRKPLRIFLQDGSNDLNNIYGSWPNANKDLADALQLAGYDYKFVFGEGGHTLKHGGSIFADSLRWLFAQDNKL